MTEKFECCGINLDCNFLIRKKMSVLSLPSPETLADDGNHLLDSLVPAAASCDRTCIHIPFVLPLSVISCELELKLLLPRVNFPGPLPPPLAVCQSSMTPCLASVRVLTNELV